MTDINWWMSLKEKSNSLAGISFFTGRFTDILDSLLPVTNLIKPPEGDLAETAHIELKAVIDNFKQLLADIRKAIELSPNKSHNVCLEAMENMVRNTLTEINVLPESTTEPDNNNEINSTIQNSKIVPSTPNNIKQNSEQNADSAQVKKANITDSNTIASARIKKEKTIGKLPLKSTNEIAGKLFKLEQDYNTAMEARKANSQSEYGLKNADAEEADRLESFLKQVSYWFKYRLALEHSKQVLEDNLKNQEIDVDKQQLVLQFKLEKNSHNGTYRLIKSSPKSATAEDMTILDVLDECRALKSFKKTGKTLIDDKDVIRFLRMHSKSDQLMAFKSDPLSQIAEQMYALFTESVLGLRKLMSAVIKLINCTPMRDLEPAFFGINPEDCKILLKLQFQSILPGLNEDHYYIAKNGKPQKRKVRTLETMEEYDRKFQKFEEEVLYSIKSTLAMLYWVRKMLTSVLRTNNMYTSLTPQQRKNEDPKANHLMKIGISNTIGDEEIANFYVSPDDIIGSEGSIQRSDRADKWMLVRKSEKLHRLPKKDFFSILQLFFQKSLNVALNQYGFNQVDLKLQLLPEIQERLEDVERIEAIRSTILGTGIITLDDFTQNVTFHNVFKRYFKKPTYDDMNYPEKEKLCAIAEGLMYSNTSILQMKYRKVFTIKEEILKRIKSLKAFIQQERAQNKIPETKQQIIFYAGLNKIISKILSIMELAKPSLKQIQIEPAGFDSDNSKDVFIVKDQN